MNRYGILLNQYSVKKIVPNALHRIRRMLVKTSRTEIKMINSGESVVSIEKTKERPTVLGFDEVAVVVLMVLLTVVALVVSGVVVVIAEQDSVSLNTVVKLQLAAYVPQL